MPDAVGTLSVVILGAGGFGREVLDVIEAANAVRPVFEFLGYLDDAPVHLDRLAARGARVLDGFDDPALDGAHYLVGVGHASARREMSLRAEEAGLVATCVRHPTATSGALNTIGAGFIACAHASFTTNVQIGRHVHLNLNSTVGHDCVLGDYVTVNPGANLSGNVTLGEGVTIGTGAAVIQGVTIGAGTMVGAGSVVTRDLPEGVVAMGSPARPVHPVD